MAARIRDVQVAAGPFEARIDAAAFTADGWRRRTRSLIPVSAGTPVIPAPATRPAVWEAAFAVLRQHAPEPVTCFTHRDFQPFNLLWRRGRLTGVVDWTRSCTGPAGFDAGHCRLNLAVLFGADWAERLRLAYEAEAGRAIDPWWDLYAVTAYGDEWRRFIPVQVAGRAPVDTAGMTSRVEDLLEATLGLLWRHVATACGARGAASRAARSLVRRPCVRPGDRAGLLLDDAVCGCACAPAGAAPDLARPACRIRDAPPTRRIVLHMALSASVPGRASSFGVRLSRDAVTAGPVTGTTSDHAQWMLAGPRAGRAPQWRKH